MVTDSSELIVPPYAAPLLAAPAQLACEAGTKRATLPLLMT